MATTGEAIDGRAARSRRTRDAVIGALMELVGEGDPTPSAQRIADRAGISVRSVYGHFASLEDLHAAALEQATALVLARLAPIDPGETLEARVDLLCGQRARINEELGPLLWAAELHERTSTVLAGGRDFARRASREQLERIFASELATLEPGARRRRVAAVDALIGLHAWRLLRGAHGLSPDEARLATREAVEALLRDPG